MTRKRWLALGGAVVALVLAGTLTASAVFAQGATPTTTSGATSTATSGTNQKTTLWQSFIDQLAKNLGVSTDTLQSALKTSGDQMVDNAVASGKLTQQQGNNIKQRIDSGQGFAFPWGAMLGRQMLMHHTMVAVDKGVADALGMTPQELQSELDSGKTITQIIAERGKSVDDVVNAVVAQAKTKLDQAVANQKLTQEQETKILDALRTRLTNAINNNTFGTHPHRAAPNTTPNTTPSATPSA